MNQVCRSVFPTRKLHEINTNRQSFGLSHVFQPCSRLSRLAHALSHFVPRGKVAKEYMRSTSLETTIRNVSEVFGVHLSLFTRSNTFMSIYCKYNITLNG